METQVVGSKGPVKPVWQTVNEQLPIILLAASMFFTGASGLVSEYILSSVSSYILGNSIEQFSIIIALMMLMMGVGGIVQRYVSDSKLIEKFILLEVSLALLIGFAPIAIYAAFGLMMDHFKVVQYFFIMSIGFLVGFEIPLVMRINSQYVGSLKANFASTYAFDYIGAFIGAVIWVLFLLRNFSLTEISFLVAGANFFIATITFVYFVWQKKVTRVNLSFLVILIAIGGLIFGYVSNESWNENLEQKLYKDPIVFSETTKYQRIVLTHNKKVDDYRLYLNGHLQLSSTDEQMYHEQLVHPAMSLAKAHDNVLVLGGGDGMAMREILKYKDVKNATLVDLDPAMVELFSTDSQLAGLNNRALVDARVNAEQAGGIFDKDKTEDIYQKTEYRKERGQKVIESVAQVSIFTIDADQFINNVDGKWDVIIIDFPDPRSVELAKLYSKEFFLKLRRVLSVDGIIAIQATSPYHAKETFLAIGRTIEAAGYNVLPYHDNVPSFGEWGWLLVWEEGELSKKDMREKITKMDNFQVDTRYITPQVFQGALVFGKGALESENTDVSTIMKPSILNYYLHEGWKD